MHLLTLREVKKDDRAYMPKLNQSNHTKSKHFKKAYKGQGR